MEIVQKLHYEFMIPHPGKCSGFATLLGSCVVRHGEIRDCRLWSELFQKPYASSSNPRQVLKDWMKKKAGLFM